MMAALVGASGCQQRSSPPARPRPAPAPQSKPFDATDIVGITLGAPADFPECAKESTQGYISYKYPPSPIPCWKNTNGPGKSITSKQSLGLADGERTERTLELGNAGAPRGVMPWAKVTFVGNVPQEVSLQTDVDDQQSIYEMLTSKYGKAGVSNVKDLQNAMGARYQSIEAQWTLPSMTIIYFGMLKRDEGMVIASTKEELKRRQGPKRAPGF